MLESLDTMIGLNSHIRQILATITRHITRERAVGAIVVVMIALYMGMVLTSDPSENDVPVGGVILVLSMFLCVGLLILTRGTRLESFFGMLAASSIIIGFGWIFNWGAFGPGVRECTRTITLPFWSDSSRAGDLECRIVIGFFAFMFDAFLFMVLAGRVAVVFGDRPWTKALMHLSGGVMLLSLTPLLLIAVSIALITNKWDSLKTFITKLLNRNSAKLPE